MLSNHPFMVPGNLFKRMSEPDGTGPDAHPVVQGQAALDAWLEALLEVAREKAQAESRQ